MALLKKKLKHKQYDLLINISIFVVVSILMFFIWKALYSLSAKIQPGYYYEVCDPSNIGSCDQQFHHSLLPSFTTTCNNSGGLWLNITYKTNSLGFRDKEYNKTKCSNCYRILFIGDSFTYGKGINKEDSFDYIIESHLNNLYDFPIEVINTGIDSNSVVLEYLMIKYKLLSLDPDLVILNFDISDVIQDLMYLKSATFSKESELMYVNGCDNNLRNYPEIEKEIISETEFLSEEQKNEILKSNTPIESIIVQREYINSEFVNRSWDTTFYYLYRISELLEKNNITLVVVTYPYLFQIDEGENLLDPQERIKEFCDQNNLLFLDLTTDFKDCEDCYINLDIHWS